MNTVRKMCHSYKNGSQLVEVRKMCQLEKWFTVRKKYVTGRKMNTVRKMSHSWKNLSQFEKIYSSRPHGPIARLGWRNNC